MVYSSNSSPLLKSKEPSLSVKSTSFRIRKVHPSPRSAILGKSLNYFELQPFPFFSKNNRIALFACQVHVEVKLEEYS